MGGWGLKVPSLFSKVLVAKSVWNIIHGSRLWVQIVIQKYIRPLSLLDWIRVSDKKKSGISICWKSMLWSFHLIGYFLVWKIGNGVNVRIGMDPWVGCKWRHSLPSQLTNFLHSAGYYFLSNVGIVLVTNLMEQVWLSSNDLGLVDNHYITACNSYIAMLKASHIRFRNEEDVLVWNQAKSGVYTPKFGYMHLIQDQHDRETEWWWNMFWNL